MGGVKRSRYTISKSPRGRGLSVVRYYSGYYLSMSVVSDTGERASLSVEQNEMSGERASTENPASSPEAHSRTAALPREDQVTSSQTTPYSPSPGPVLSVSHNGRRALESSESTASGKLRSSSGGTHHKRAIREREGERDSGREVIPKTTRNVLAG